MMGETSEFGASSVVLKPIANMLWLWGHKTTETSHKLSNGIHGYKESALLCACVRQKELGFFCVCCWVPLEMSLLQLIPSKTVVVDAPM